MNSLPLIISPLVKRALEQGSAVLALESTVITHGLPYPDNLEALAMLEESAREHGATPATICLLDGVFHIGLDGSALELLTHKLLAGEPLQKLAYRDLAMAVAQKSSGGTTVSATMYLAYLAGIKVFSTGGIGGVHRNWQSSLDISLDIKALATIPTLVVCAGCKAILDIPATMEVLESAGVPVYGWQTDEFPSFYSRRSGISISKLDSLSAIAEAFRIHRSLSLISGGMLIANPIPQEFEIPTEIIEPFIQRAIEDAKGISGKELTPFLLANIAEITKSKSVEANLALLKNNVILGAKIAGEMT
jgi:pseudouridine-5'-phosphate glycosidase